MWRYAEETFEFHRGRLLLRGPNGAGKSLALELLLPFLLDADASPARLTSATKSRGGLYDRVMTGSEDPSRTAFTWVEFRRGDAAFTVGARIRVSRSTGRPDVDYFTTDQRIGHDLHLLDAQRVPLSGKELRAAIGGRGRVHGTPGEHRSAVRTTLYAGFEPERYASVITSLLALRKEKLSQNLDLDKLSAVLSAALPPIDDRDVTAVAEGFERLDRRRGQLEGLRAELHAVQALQDHQRRYARSVLVWLAEEVRTAESARDAVTRRSREVQDTLRTERARRDGHRQEKSDLDGALRRTGAQIEALVGSDAYRRGADLVELRNQIVTFEGMVGSAQKALASAEKEQHTAQGHLSGAGTDLADAERHLQEAREELRRRSDALGVEGLAEDAFALQDSASGSGDAQALVLAWIDQRRVDVHELRGLVRVHRLAAEERDHRASAVEHDITVFEEAAEKADRARAAATAAAEEFAELVERWLTSCSIVSADSLRERFERPATDPVRVAAVVADVRTSLRADHEVALDRLAQEQTRLSSVVAELESERTRVADGTIIGPASPAWRDDREARAGAPLWRLVEAAPATSPEALDGVEAALTASGLIDAWVQPDGTVDPDPARADITLVVWPTGGRTLESVLRPLTSDHVDAAVTREVLASIALAPSVDVARATMPATSAVIGLDGTFRFGTATGRGRAAPATLLGAEAQERRRMARLAELDAGIAENRHASRDTEESMNSLHRLWDAVVAELDASPRGEDVTRAWQDVLAGETRLTVFRERLDADRTLLRESENHTRARFQQLTAAASHHSLPTDDAGLDMVTKALTALADAARTWAHRASEHHRAGLTRDRAEEVLMRAERSLETCYATHRDAETRRDELAARVEALEAVVGQEHDEVLSRLTALRESRDRDELQRTALMTELSTMDVRIGGLEATLTSSDDERRKSEEVRAAAHQHFLTAIRLELPVDADLSLAAEQLDGVTAVLEAARTVAARFPDIPTAAAARERASGRVEEQLHRTRQELGGRVDLDRAPTGDGWNDLAARMGGVRSPVSTLAAAMVAEFENASEELHAEEEQLFARVLAGDIRRALADRIRHANQLVDQINAQLVRVRTEAGGVQARLMWEVDHEQLDAVKSARTLLLRDPGDLSEGETAALHAFVRARVEQARMDLEANAPWEARLRETLDYRGWHRFTLQLGHRDWEGYRPATPRRLQVLSTGERSIALHLPMLASIAAHYTGTDGRPASCPRLIVLDELFAGVDPANRSQLFALFTDWDLDAVFTSDHEWCTYATLDGIAVHHLHPPIGDAPVTSTRFVWDGQSRFMDPGDGLAT